HGAGGGGAEAGATAGDENGNVFQLHRKNLSLGVSSLDLTCKASTGGGSRLGRFQHAAENQRFHVPDVVAANFLGDRTDADRADHGVAAEEQVVAGADQAGVEQHRID